MDSNITKLRPSFGDVLKKYRAGTHYTQPKIAEEMNITRNTYSNWENDKNKPSYDQITYLCRKFNIPVHELFGFPDPSGLDTDEKALLSVFQSLSPRGKNLVIRLAEQVRLSEDEDTVKYMQSEPEAYRPICLSDWVMAAGEGCTIPDTPLYNDVRLIRATPENQGADLIMRVSGPSMEPAYHDGDLVYIQPIDYVPHSGTVVFATVGNQCVIKRVGTDRKLHSDNQAYAFAEKYEDDNVRPRGIVLGKVDETDFCPDTQLTLFEQELAGDIQAFKASHNIYS